MTDKDVVDMASRCIDEIEQLRRRLAETEPRAEAYALINKIVGLIPGPTQSYGEDIVWRLRRQIEELKPTAEAGGNPQS